MTHFVPIAMWITELLLVTAAYGVRFRQITELREFLIAQGYSRVAEALTTMTTMIAEMKTHE